MTSTDCHVYNGMPATDLGEQGWESPWSGPNGGQCVQTKLLADGEPLPRFVRDAMAECVESVGSAAA